MSTIPDACAPALADRDTGAAPHQRLLLALTALHLDADRIAGIRSLAADPTLDRGAFLDAAARHKLLPLIGRHVHRHHLDRGSRALAHPWVLTSAYVANRIRNAALADEFGRVQHELTYDGIRFALRKGFALAEGVLGDRGVRRIGDLDLVIHPADTEHAHSVLTRLGYVQGELAEDGDRIVPYPPDAGAPVPARAADGEFLPYRKAGHQPHVPEYYIDLCPVLPEPQLGFAELPMADVLDRARPVVRCGAPALELHPTDQLLDLWAQLRGPAQGLLEGRPRRGLLPLSKLLDVAELSATRTDSEWEETRRLAARHGLWPALDAVPHLVSLLFPTKVSATFAVAPAAIPGLVSRLV